MSMSTSKKIIIGVLLLLSSPILAIILWIGIGITHGFGLRIAGYEVDADPKALAEEIFLHKDSVNRCKNIAHALPTMGPSADDDKMRCVLEYATIAKDPSACELLMPSSYGLSCVGAAMSEYIRPCALGLDRSVTWSNGGRASLSECVNGNDHECCTVTQARFVVGFDTCNGIEDGEIKDQCRRDLAFKKADPQFCEDISNALVKSACEVESTALQKDLSICSGCTPPIESLEDLK